MCGIAGIVASKIALKAELNPLIPEEAVKTMVSSMGDRGPDSAGVVQRNRATFGHTRLAIMDPENIEANQPIESNSWLLVFNGEIYNFREIRETLAETFEFVTESDTEVLLKSLELNGVDKTVRLLNGIFAFAAFNKRTGDTYLVRDRLGIKPIYFHDDKYGLWFGSTPAAIVNAHPKPTWELDYFSVMRYFSLGAPISEGTLFTGIQRILPATILKVSADGVHSNINYWKPKFDKTDIEDSVWKSNLNQKEAHVPSALFLSGGVDSSVSALALHDLDCFHLDSPERKYAEYVSEKLGSKLIVSEFEDSAHFSTINQEYVKSSGEPSASAPIPFLVAKAIKEKGYKVAFSANGADELFFGYPRTFAPGLLDENQPANNYEAPSLASSSDQRDHIFRKIDSFEIPRLGSNLEQNYFPSELLTKLTSEFSECAQSRWFELQTYVQYDLNPTLDFSSMACSLEVRVPFLDHTLIENALSHTSNDFISADIGRKKPLKSILKKNDLSPLLWARTKVGFSVPEEILAKRESSMLEAVDELNKLGLFKLSKNCIKGSRDYQYLLSAAHSMVEWKRCWVDSGKVVL
jgi:asparagine synthase (glutamine-hydrolysing)